MSFVTDAKLKKGDLIRVKRKLGYYHYAIYIGHNEVIHYSGDSNDSIFDNSKIQIYRADLETGFLRGDILEVNVPYDSTYFRFVVCHRAKKLLGVRKFRNRVYDLLKNNCEHFATFCYYGEATSTQSEAVSTGIKGVVANVGVEIFNQIGRRYTKKKKTNKEK